MGDSGEHADWGVLAIYPELLIRTKGSWRGPHFSNSLKLQRMGTNPG